MLNFRPDLRVCVGFLIFFSIFSDLSAQTPPKKNPQKKTSAKKAVKPPPPIPVDGFWLVTKVTVGGKELTPVARWFKLTTGKQVSGNGWVQHSFGTYKFDPKKSEVTFITTNEPDDEFGAFKVERKGPLMTWSRTEEGEAVIVELKPITELPMSPSDVAKGLWILESAVERDVNITKQYDPDHKHFLFIRWDRQYVRQINAHERISGYWFFDAHRPEVTFISENREQEDEKWAVTIEGQKMTMKGSSENVQSMVLTYVRATDFPK
jgi:hypothetical protein